MKKVASDPVVKLSVSIIAIILVAIVLKELQHIFIPFVIAYLLFFLFQPINSFFVKHKFPQKLTVILDLGVIIAIIFGISQFIIGSFQRLGERLPHYEIKLNSLVRETAVTFEINQPIITQFDISEILSTLDYGGIATGFFNSTVEIFTGIFFVLFFFIFISSGHKNIYEAIQKRYLEGTARSSINKFRKRLKRDANELDLRITDDEISLKAKLAGEAKVEKTFKSITGQIQKYIALKSLLALLNGGVLALILWIFDIDFILVWAFLMMLLSFIPNIGSVVAILLPSLMALVQFESFGFALVFAGVATIIQNILGSIVEPMLLGDKLGINPLVILLSLLIWGYIWGIVGMFLSVPLTAVIYIIMAGSSSENLFFLSDLMDNEKYSAKNKSK
ncbi:MAG: AI-2E family transporter [Melioribacteraceae bacterium]|nr:AI-2E family transporter [Melioribacteraceae bacterium]MCF8264176.1 AI-2E family transporter [Melioribacteraceae bacterium]MCF8412645.1 AI-2E family transporter [Melioribacteraceae bacterium]MCF8430510.1 AI-2E family transporter [Melioribacteraceae bacterium]